MRATTTLNNISQQLGEAQCARPCPPRAILVKAWKKKKNKIKCVIAICIRSDSVLPFLRHIPFAPRESSAKRDWRGLMYNSTVSRVSLHGCCYVIERIPHHLRPLKRETLSHSRIRRYSFYDIGSARRNNSDFSMASPTDSLMRLIYWPSDEVVKYNAARTQSVMKIKKKRAEAPQHLLRLPSHIDGGFGTISRRWCARISGRPEVRVAGQ